MTYRIVVVTKGGEAYIWNQEFDDADASKEWLINITQRGYGIIGSNGTESKFISMDSISSISVEELGVMK